MIKKVLKRSATLLAVLVLSMTLAGCFGSGGGGESGGEASEGASFGQLFIASEDTELVLYAIIAGVPVEISRAGLPAAGLLTEHAIFGITMHPTQNWVYVTSLNNYNDATGVSWGNARIDRFTYTPLGLTYDGVAFTYGPGSGPPCADEDWDIPGQSGTCAPTTLAFSPDGLRAYVDDDRYDEIHIFAVDPVTGDLTFLWFGANTRLNGLTVSPNSGYLYNGRNILQIVGDTAVNLNWSSLNRGNATEVISYLGVDLLATTWNNNTLEIYDLVDQSAPALIDSLVIPDAPDYCWGPGPAVFQASSADASLFVVVGSDTVATVLFDGTTLTLLDQVFADNGNEDVINRGVAVSDDGTYAVVTWFVNHDEICDALAVKTGGITTYSIAEDGTLTEVGTITFNVPARQVIAVPQ